MKKFVKGLLVSGFAVALLAGCSNKGKSCEPCPPVPEPETKKAWTDEELEILNSYYHDEIPFACELSLEGIEDGVLYAVSKDEVSDEDLLAYDDMFQEDGHFSIYNVGPVTGGLSADVGELGFDLSGDVFQYYRPYKDEAAYSLTRFYTIGLNEDGHLQVAMSASLTPLFSLSNGKIGTGGLYSMLFDDEKGEEFNFLNEYYIWAANSNVSQQAGSPSYCDPFYYLTKYIFPDLLVKETDTATHYTLGSYDSLAVYAPFTSGNVLSDEFNSRFSITLADFDVAGDKLSDFYTEEDYQGVLTWFDRFVNAGIYEVIDSSMEEGEHGPEASVLVKDTEGFTSEFTVSFLTYGEGEAVETYLEFGYELVDFKLPSGGIYVADAILESINPNFDYTTLQAQKDSYNQYTVIGAVAIPASETYTVAEAAEDAIDAIVENGIAKEYELDYLVPEEGELVIFATYLQGSIETKVTVYCLPYVVQGTNAIVTQVMAQERNVLGTISTDGQLLSDYYSAIMELVYPSFSTYIEEYTQASLADINAMTPMVNADSLVGLDAAIAAGFENLDGINSLRLGGVGLLDYLFGFKIDETTGVVTWSGYYSQSVVNKAEQFSENEENYTPEDCATFDKLYDAVKACVDNDPSSRDFYAKLVTSLYALLNFENTVKPWNQQAQEYLAEKWTYQESDYSAENWALIQGYYNDIEPAWNRANFKSIVDAAVENADAVPTKLQEYKDAKLAALQTVFAGYQEADYYAEGWNALNTACQQGQTAIQNASSEAAVDEAYNACVAAMDAVPTKAEVDAYRTTKLADLQAAYNSYVAPYQPTDSQYVSITEAYNSGVEKINAANTISAIDAEYEACDTAMHKIK